MEVLAGHYYSKNKELFLVLSLPGGTRVEYQLLGSTLRYTTDMETFQYHFKYHNP